MVKKLTFKKNYRDYLDGKLKLATYQKVGIVLLIAFFVTGFVELVGGWLVYTIGDGLRYWDYNNQLWNFGNIGGFICLLSVTVFALGCLALMYIVLPFCVYLA